MTININIEQYPTRTCLMDELGLFESHPSEWAATYLKTTNCWVIRLFVTWLQFRCAVERHARTLKIGQQACFPFSTLSEEQCAIIITPLRELKCTSRLYYSQYWANCAGHTCTGVHSGQISSLEGSGGDIGCIYWVH